MKKKCCQTEFYYLSNKKLKVSSTNYFLKFTIVSTFVLF